MTGNLAYEPSSARFLLDESLVPAVARALTLVGYDFIDVRTVIRESGATDPEIIEWCRENATVWVHADDRARKQHRVLLQTSGIRTLWIYRRQGTMTAREQLRILASVLPSLFERWEKSPNVRHYRASASSPLSKPSLRPMDV